MSENIPFAKKLAPLPYWGCPRCGGNCWGATNLNKAEDEEYIYSCHGYSIGGLVRTPGCGMLFRLPPEVRPLSENLR